MPSEGTGQHFGPPTKRQVEQHFRALEAAIFDLRKKNEELDKGIVELRRLLTSPN